MVAILRLLAAIIANLFKSRRRLEAEILFLRQRLRPDTPGHLPTFFAENYNRRKAVSAICPDSDRT